MKGRVNFLLFHVFLASILWVESESNVFAQNNLVVFNNGNEKFYLYINGVKQNTIADNNVRVTNIKQPWVKVKIVFEDNKRIPDLTTNVQFVWEAETKKGWEFVYQIVNKAGKYKIKPYSAAPIDNEKTMEGQTTVNYLSEEAVPNVSPIPIQGNVPTQSSQTITTTTVISISAPANTVSTNGSTNISINISASGGNIQIHDGTNTANNNTSVTTSVVSTTVISSNISTFSNSNVSAPPTTVQAPVAKCSVSEKEFESIKSNISSKSFEDSKLIIAKQISDSKCLSSKQVRDIMKLFSFEETRLEFAKYAYKKVVDKENYYMVNDAFQFESSIEELNESIEK